MFRHFVNFKDGISKVREKIINLNREEKMNKIPFDEKELEVTEEIPAFFPGMPPTRIYGKRPISAKENFRLTYEGKQLWIPISGDSTFFCPSVVPDNIARGFVFAGEAFDNVKNGGGPDMFGIDWVYVPSAGGSMVQPGNPTLLDANDWEKVIKFPDVRSWDWAKSVELNKDYVSKDRWLVFWILSGAWFERLVSFMDFDAAVMALIDEDQQEAVHALFTKTTQVMCDLVDVALEYFPEIDSFTVHDDWGSQAQPFFSYDTAMEMIVPHMKVLTDHIHSKGKIADMHSCGHTEKRVECYIAAGWDSWSPQPMNDSAKLFDEYGDKIIIGAAPELEVGMTPEQQGEAGKKYAERFIAPGKSVHLGYGSVQPSAPEFYEELYKTSRLLYLER